MRLNPLSLLLTVGATAEVLMGQAMPAVRPLGPITAVSAPGLLRSVSYVRALPQGRLLVSDVLRAQVFLFNAALEKVKSVNDSGLATPVTRFSPRGALLAYRGDSSLVMDVASLAMLVLDADGNVARVMALPTTETTSMLGGPFGTPAYDRHDRLVFRKAFPQSIRETTETTLRISYEDTVPILRVTIGTRERETVAYVKLFTTSLIVNLDHEGRERSSTLTQNPYAIVDDWSVMRDGRIAIVRGTDLHVDWVDDAGRMVSTAKLPFPWERLDDDAKVRLVDSVNTALDSARQVTENRRLQEIASSQGRATAETQVPTSYLKMVPPQRVADYRPAFRPGATKVDWDGNLWVRTTSKTESGPIYYVIDGRGTLIDRVRIPFGRVIAGFGPGEVYMGVLDEQGARLERARIH